MELQNNFLTTLEVEVFTTVKCVCRECIKCLYYSIVSSTGQIFKGSCSYLFSHYTGVFCLC